MTLKLMQQIKVREIDRIQHFKIGKLTAIKLRGLKGTFAKLSHAENNLKLRLHFLSGLL